MTIDNWLKIGALVITFFQVMIWPLVLILLLFLLREPLKAFLSHLSVFTVKAGGMEASAQTQLQAGIALGAAVASEQKEGEQAGTEQAIATLVLQNVTPQKIQQVAGKTVLWVDDNPHNNTYQRNALETLGIRFTICTTTKIALQELATKTFDLIISDMARQNETDPQAGFTLLEELRKKQIKVPLLFYARGGKKSGNREEAQRRGAIDWVTGPQALFERVITILTRAA